MNNYSHRIALIIPTRNRPELLKRLLTSLYEQTIQADQTIIVDGSDEPIKEEISLFLKPGTDYTRVFPPSLTKQRNYGLKVVKNDITLVGYLDDDIVMEKDAVEAMLRFWETCPDNIGGASFNITNSSPVKVTLLVKLFCLDDDKKGKVLKSGMNTGVAPVTRNIYTEWLCGGATVWRKKIFEEFKYDEWYIGWAYYEDLDFSFSVSKKHKLAVISSARVLHLPPPLKPQKVSSFIKMHIIQQYYFVKKHKELPIPCFYWSILGKILLLILVGFRRLQPANFSVARVYMSGLLNVITGKLHQVDEAFRE